MLPPSELAEACKVIGDVLVVALAAESFHFPTRMAKALRLRIRRVTKKILSKSTSPLQ